MKAAIFVTALALIAFPAFAAGTPKQIAKATAQVEHRQQEVVRAQNPQQLASREARLARSEARLASLTE